MKKLIAICALTISAMSYSPEVEAFESCTSATVSMFGFISETMTTCADGSGSLYRTNSLSGSSCLIVWNSSGETIYGGCNKK